MKNQINRYSSRIIYIITILFIFSGCGPLTYNLNINKGYNENIEGFILLKEGKQLLAVSNKYNYIFDISEELKSILTSKYRKDLKLKAEFSPFYIKNHINIEGEYSILYTTKKHLPLEIEDWFFDSGFTKKIQKLPTTKSQLKMQNKLVYTKKEKLYGKRYLPDENLTKEITTKFNNKYNRIQIFYDKEYVNDEETRKYLTPITIVLDTALITAWIASIVVVYGYAIPSIGIMATIEHNRDPYKIQGIQTESLYKKYKVSSKFEFNKKKQNIFNSTSKVTPLTQKEIEIKIQNEPILQKNETEYFFWRIGIGTMNINKSDFSESSMTFGLQYFKEGLVNDGMGVGLSWDGTSKDIENSDNMLFKDIYGVELLYNFNLKNNYCITPTLFIGKISEEIADSSYNKLQGKENSANGVGVYFNFSNIIKTGSGASIFYKYLRINKTSQTINLGGINFVW